MLKFQKRFFFCITRRAFLTIGILVVGNFVGFAQNGSQVKRMEAEIRQTERDWNEAIVKKDLAALDQIIADDFIFIDSAGGVHDKKNLMEIVSSPDYQIEPMTTEEVKIRIYGDTAVVTGFFVQKGKFKGRDFSVTYRYTDVYVRRGKRWLGVSAQSAVIPRKS